jgi:hypothetical protein
MSRQIIIRLYALVILLVIVWTGYTAVTYLFRSVFTPVHVPEHMKQWAAVIDTSTLVDRDRATEAQMYPRAPLRHFHTLGALFEPAPNTGCTTSGCHGTLSHRKRKEIRAFANLHTTFMTCRMCHTADLTNPTEAMWIRADDGMRMETPPLLDLIRLLETQAIQINESPAEHHLTIIEYLRQAVEASRQDPILQYLLTQLETSEPGSPVWRGTVVQLRSELPNHARGEYGAMITPVTTNEQEQTFRARQRDLARKYFAAEPDSEEAEAIHKQIHERITTEPKGCTVCHGDEPPRLQFENLGYSSQRATLLRDAPTARMMIQIQQGHPFHLPRPFGEDGG